MDKPLELSKDDQLRLMRSLYSVFYRDEKINDIEQSVLSLFNNCFDLKTKDYIANEINLIKDVRVRIYFMRIILDVYREEIKEWFNGASKDHALQFRKMYNSLQNGINITSNCI